MPHGKMKVISIVLGVFFLITSLAGCGSKTAPDVSTENNTTANADNTSVSQNTEGEQATISMWFNTPLYESYCKQIAETFMQRNPGIKVQYETKTGDKYFSLLNTAIQAGSAPDLFWTLGTKTQTLPDMVKQGVVMDLTGKVDVSQWEKSTPMSVEVCKIDGRLYLTPICSVDSRVVFYNKEIFEKYSLNVPKTFDDFIAICDKLMQNNITPMSLAGNDSWDILFCFEPILAAVAPDWLDEATAGNAKVNDERMVNALKLFCDWAQKGYFGKGYAGMDDAGQLLSFSTGKVAMTIAGTWVMESVTKNNPDLKLGTFKLPTKDGVRPMVVTPNSGCSVYSKTKYPEQAVKLAQFLASQEGQQIYMTEVGAIPGAPELKAKNELIQEMGACDKQVESFYNIIGWYPKDGKEPRKIWEQDSPKVLSGFIKPEEFIKYIDDMIDYSKVNKVPKM